MKRTKKLLSQIQEILNKNERCQDVMSELAKEAEARNMSQEDWKKVKISIMTGLFYQLAMEVPEIKANLGKDFWEEVNKTPLVL